MKTRIFTTILPSVVIAFSSSSLSSLAFRQSSTFIKRSIITTTPAITRMMSISSTSTSTSTADKHVLVPIGNGSEEIESVTIIDTLVRGGAKVTVASVADTRHVIMSRGVRMTADVLINECIDKQWDMIALPGGMPGAEHLRDSSILISLLEKQNNNNAPIAAMCAAPAIVLASKGFLTNKIATCYPAEKFRNMLPKSSNDQIVIDNNIITSQGPGDSLKFALKLVEILFGSEKSTQISKEMLVI